ncbi:MAG: TonB-dependent receptor [bacterium]
MKKIIVFFISIFLFSAVSYAENKKTIILQDEFVNKKIENSENFFRIYTGTDITDYGQPGIPRYISLLGLSNRHTLITLDGQKINSIQDGNANLNHIPISLVESIEINKGINSVSDGPGVFGGTINFLTSKPVGDIPYTCLYSRWGTSGLENYGLNFRNQNGSLHYSVFADKFFSHGYGFYKKNNKINSVNLYSKIDWFYDNKTWFTLTSDKYEDKTGVSSPAGFWADKNKNRHFQLKYETRQSKTALKIKFYGSADWLEQDDSNTLYIYENSRQGNEGILEQNIGKYHLIRVGKAHHWNKFHGNFTQNNYDDVLSKEDAFFFEDEINLNNLILSLGQRYDKNSLFPKEKSPRFKLNYRISDKSEMFLSAGEGASFPNINDLYMKSAFYKGNVNLVTEKARVYTLGFEKIFSDFVFFNLTGHIADVKNFLSWNYNPGSGYHEAENVSSVTTKGAETELKFTVNKNVEIQTIYTYLFTKDKETQKDLPYRPANKLKTNLIYKKIKYDGDLLWTVRLNHEYLGNRYLNRENSSELKNYSIIDLNISMKLAGVFTVNLAGNNLANNEYVLVEGYPMPGRNFWGGIVWEFWD